ncbi:MAG: carotenoid oxygenase family protein [Myxococcales bacterium]|nr:carotenoid oxygenase family protein [Myxococcales bacterium]
MSRPYPDDPFLQGNFAPWPMEGEIRDLVVKGEVPRELCGSLYRNGPNPQFAPRMPYHWFDGDGMIHAFHIEDGRVDYRNRWIRTERFQLERTAGESLFGGLVNLTASDARVQGLSGNAANTNIVWHAGRLLALWEAGPPHQLDPETLETLGVFDFDGRLSGPMTAHPKLDPETGEMLMFGYDMLPPELVYTTVSAEGELVRSEPIQVPFPSMIHDFVTTREHVIFPIFPAALRPESLAQGELVRWEPDLGTHIGVMPRDGGNADVVWFQTDPCFVYHFLNAHTAGESVVVEAVRHPRVPFFSLGTDRAPGDLTHPALVRWSLNLGSGTLKQETLDEGPLEFPRLDERFAGLAYRHGFAAGRGREGADGWFNAIVHHDLQKCERHTHELGPTSFTSEPVFVPRHADSAEGDGFLLCVVFRQEENRSDLVILDAGDLAGPPLAEVCLPHRIPYGFHGNWRPGPRRDP